MLVMQWWRRRVSVRIESAEPDSIDELSAEQRGNVTPAHRKQLAELSLSPDPAGRPALRACLEQLRTSTITAAPEVRVEQAWTDGPEAFCVIYSPPYGPDMRVGIRRHINDDDYEEYELGSMSPGYDLGDGDYPDPVAFGEASLTSTSGSRWAT
jgi:hypothetical protein